MPSLFDGTEKSTPETQDPIAWTKNKNFAGPAFRPSKATIYHASELSCSPSDATNPKKRRDSGCGLSRSGTHAKSGRAVGLARPEAETSLFLPFFLSQTQSVLADQHLLYPYQVYQELIGNLLGQPDSPHLLALLKQIIHTFILYPCHPPIQSTPTNSQHFSSFLHTMFFYQI